jgi:DNA-binding response OmpR family regulator
VAPGPELRIVYVEAHLDRSIDVVVSRVRQNIEGDPRDPRLLETIRGVGYMLTPGER